MQIRKLVSLVLAGIMFSATSALPQNQLLPSGAGRPKLGLVLEGGGALGLAHIGVIQWMEEHRIPVSYVAGTSMGGLVGGLYATGRSASEVRQIVQGIDWDAVLRGQTPYSDLTFRRKEDARDYPSTLEFGLHKGLHLPEGFNSGQQVSLILDPIALPYSELSSFNELPIPFACVATDLQSGKPYVFRSGSLALALRSTMSLPGLFTPVRSDNHIFADGGLLQNIPIDVAKEMGADVVLGVHLEVAPLDPDASLSSFGVLGRSVSVMIAANELRSMEKADLLVSVPLQKYTSLDYNQANEIIKAGYDAAASKSAVLSTFSVDESTWKQYLADREARRKTTPVPQFVEVVGGRPELAHDVEKSLSDLAGTPVNTDRVNKDIMAMSGTGQFLSLTYSMVERNNQQGLQIQTERKPYIPPLVRPLIFIDGSQYNNVLFTVGARITYTDFGRYRSELRNDVIVGSNYGLDSEYYHPFKPTTRWFISPRVGLFSTQLNLYSDQTLLATYRQKKAGGGVDAGYAFGRSGELRLGYEGAYERLSPIIGNSSVLPTVSGQTGDIRAQYQVEDTDNPVVPLAGRRLLLYAKGFVVNPDAPGAFPLAEVQSSNFFPLNGRSSVYFNPSGGTSFGYKTGIPSFSLGGARHLVAWGSNELLTNQYFLFQMGYIRTLASLPPFLGDKLDFVSTYELGKTYQLPNGPKPPNLPMDFAAGLIATTIIGPIEIGGAVGDYGRARFFFQIGRAF
jgi:NTE family protein